MNRLSPVAAAVLILAALITFFGPRPSGGEALADNVLMLPEGGMLNALDAHGNILGPCPLKHTDVDVEISGSFARVTLRQRFYNPYEDKIEAVYTFPMSHNGAVDRMTMTIGDRVVIGEVHERRKARRIYEAARRQGHVAGLLEQERPNIFTQSVANIEPDVEVLVEISYVELIETTDGLSEFTFPMVVGPRYIPGRPAAPIKFRNPAAPLWMEPREGLVLLAPAELTILEAADNAPEGLDADWLQAVLDVANPITISDRSAWQSGEGEDEPVRAVSRFQVDYPGVSREYGALYSDGTGEIAGRAFVWKSPEASGAGIARGTDQVPDAGRISPRVAPPETRSGQSISITVDIDTGGPGIADLDCALHEAVFTEHALRHDGLANAITIELADEVDIPNRDFVLTWRPVAEEITESVFTHTGEHGNFVTLILQPPARVEPADIVPRELIFVLDTSGSMSGEPIAKAKAFINKAIGAMHPDDTFNVITFSGDTQILWDEPDYASDENVAAAQGFIETRAGGGGTEMMKAIEAALYQPAPEQAEAGAAAADAYRPLRIVIFFTDGYVGNDMGIIDAIRRNAETTRVFSVGVGNSVNRYLLDGMAKAGRGVAEYLLLEDDADAKVDRLLDRIERPVLTNIELEFGEGLTVLDMIPAVVGDLWDERPIIVHAQYDEPGEGTLTIRGNAGDGRYERAIDLVLPEHEPEHDVIATLWARAKVEEVMNEDLAAAQRGTFPPALRQKIIDLGETFQIMTQFTSFVAVEHSRVTIEGRPLLVPVPVELPDGVSYEGACGRRMFDFAKQLAASPETIPAAVKQSYDAEDRRRRTEAGIPYDENMTYPKNWLEITANRGDVAGVTEAKENQDVRRRLKRAVPEIDFDALRFSDVIDRLRAMTGLNIVPNWSALEALAIEKDAEVTLRLTNLSFEKALELILTEVGAGEVELGYEIADGVVQVSTKEDLDRRGSLRAYSLASLPIEYPEIRVPTFRPPRIDLAHIGRDTGQQEGGVSGGRFIEGGGVATVGSGFTTASYDGAASRHGENDADFYYSPLDTQSAVDMWGVVRAGNATPKQFIAPSTTVASNSAVDTSAYYDFDAGGYVGGHLSYAYQYRHDPSRPLVGASSTPAFPVMADANPYIKRDAEVGAVVYELDISPPTGGGDRSSAVLVTAGKEALADVERVLDESSEVGAKLAGEVASSQPVAEIIKITYAVLDFTADTPPPNPSPERKRRVDGPVAENPLANARGSDMPGEPANNLARLARWLRIHVAPDSWKQGGDKHGVTGKNMATGEGTVFAKGAITIDGATLVIEQTPPVHQRIAAALAELRRARFVPLGPDSAVIQIAAVLATGDIDTARTQAILLAQHHPDYGPADLLLGLLENGVLTPDHRLERVGELRAAAAETIRQQAAQIATVTRRVDERLLQLMWGNVPADVEKAVTIGSGTVLVSILTTDCSAETRTALETAGLKIEATTPSAQVFIGKAPLSRLTPLALLDQVRRINPVAPPKPRALTSKAQAGRR